MNRAREFDPRPTPRGRRRSAWRAAAIVALIVALLTAVASAHPHADSSGCGAVGTWLDPSTDKTIATDRLLAGLAQRPVVLLGEAHDSAEQHRWQLYTLAALHGLKPDLILGFESFPRRVQPILDQWVNGELDAAAFLEAVDWDAIWGFDPALYLPLFNFARQNRVPMIALNVDRDLVSRVRHEGWAAIPADERAGLSDPAAASAAYRKSLAEVYAVEQSHKAKNSESGNPHRATAGADAPAVETGEVDAPEVESFAVEIEAPAVESFAVEIDAPADETKGRADGADASLDEADASAGDAEVSAVDIKAIVESEDFARFVAAQLTWDRAMAEAIAAARQRQPGSLVVGIMGRGHLEHGYGVPHQLVDLGISEAAVVLPVESAVSCEELPADLADAVFVIEPTASVATAPPKARLGVMLEMTDDGVKIAKVMEGSVAEAIALEANDIVVAAAGFPIAQLGDLIEIVQRQAPGTWLPLTIRRDGENLEFVAKFPTRFDSPE